MCLIIDNNKCGEFFRVPLGELEALIVEWIGRRGRIAIGGRLRSEMLGNRKMRSFLSELKRGGRLTEIDDSLVNLKESELEDSGLLSSDDPHVIALALISGARLLHTSDAALILDFKSSQVISKPRGKIFNGNTNLFRTHGVCSNC